MLVDVSVPTQEVNVVDDVDGITVELVVVTLVHDIIDVLV